MKKLLSVLLCAIFLLGMTVVSVSAEEADVPPIDVSFSTRKDNFDANDTIRATLEIRNTNPYPLTNLSVKIEAPEGYEIRKADQLPFLDTLKAGKKASYTIKMVPQGKKVMGTGTIVILVGGVLLTAAAVATVLILIRRKKLRANAVVSALIVCVMVANIGAMWLPVEAAEVTRFILTQEIPLTIDGQPQKAVATVYYDNNPLAEEITLDTSRLSYSSVNETFVTTQDFDGFHGTLAHPKQYQTVLLEVLDPQGHVLQEATTNAAKQWHFSEVALCPGNNHVRITAIGAAPLVLEFDLFDLYGNTYHLLEGYEDDTDKDGLPDLVENALGTDPTKADTDGDGLSDVDELDLDLDPTKADTDDNGIPDGKEDSDDDGINNANELKQGLSPILSDTDRDGLSDTDELNQYNTDPLKEDTDGDGASDGWELDHGYNPKSTNTTFSLSCETAPIDKTNLVSAEVSLKVNGKEADVESLEINRVSYSNNPYFSRAIVGYLGSAFDFNINGEFDSATLTFHYDTALGKPGDDFQPRIYHFNEDTKKFEELPNQTVKDGVVTAKTTHFSVYALLNKVTYEDAFRFDQETMDMLAGQVENWATADIVIAMDASASMAWNDADNKSNEVANLFVDQLREKLDSIAVMSYTGAPTLLQPFTSNKEDLKKALNKITPDNGVNSTSGTNGAAALTAALDLFKVSGASYRYILFFTDGDDDQLKAQYKQIIQRAKNADVRILCVGVHSPKASYLKELASQTAGRYFTLNQDTDVDTTFTSVVEVFDLITPSADDKNQDGLPDFVARLVYEGKIPLLNGSRELMAVDLNSQHKDNPIDDWDGDGLKNGEEIKLHYANNILCIKMISRPDKSDSDDDGLSDRLEIMNGMDPMTHSKQTAPLNVLQSTTFTYRTIYNEYYDNPAGDFFEWFNQVSLKIDGVLFKGGQGREEAYNTLITDFYNQHAEEALEEAERAAMTSSLSQLVDDMKADIIFLKDNGVKTASGYNDWWKMLADGHECAYELAELAKKKDPDFKIPLTKEFIKDFSKIGNELSDLTNDAFNELFKGQFAQFGLTELDLATPLKKVVASVDKHADKLDEGFKRFDTLSTGFNYLEMGVDIIGMYQNAARIQANCAVYQQNEDALTEIAHNAKDEYAQKAAETLLTHLATEFQSAFLKAVSQMSDKLFTVGAEHVVGYLAKNFPYVKLVTFSWKTAISITDFLTHSGDRVEATYKILCYTEIADAYVRLIKKSDDLPLTEALFNDYQRYVDFLARAHIAGEEAYVKYDEAEMGAFKFWYELWGNADNAKNRVEPEIDKIKKAADAIRNVTIFN